MKTKMYVWQQSKIGLDELPNMRIKELAEYLLDGKLFVDGHDIQMIHFIDKLTETVFFLECIDYVKQEEYFENLLFIAGSFGKNFGNYIIDTASLEISNEDIDLLLYLREE